MVRLMIEEDFTWQRAADAVGLKHSRAYRALHKPHFIAYRRQQRKEQIELLSTRVPFKLSALMESENAAAAVRAALAPEEMSNQSRAEPTRRIQTGGIVMHAWRRHAARSPCHGRTARTRSGRNR